jgi:hypothetical protein
VCRLAEDVKGSREASLKKSRMRRVWNKDDDRENIQKLGKRLTEIIERFGVSISYISPLLV